ncbi:MAG: hypothetical protein ACKOET_18800 [Verrucomicrobiota bacterium]
MNRIPRLGGGLIALALLAAGCSKPDPTAELQKAAAELEKAPPAQAEPAAAPEGQVAVSPAQQLQGAMEDYKAGKLEDAVTRLQLLRAQSALSPQQRMALQDSIAAVVAEIYALAEKGDPKAIAAVAQYERMQTRR